LSDFFKQVLRGFPFLKPVFFKKNCIFGLSITVQNLFMNLNKLLVLLLLFQSYFFSAQTLLKDINAYSNDATFGIGGAETNNLILFGADDNSKIGHELWQTDGTANGTKLLFDIATDENKGSKATNFLSFKNRAFFSVTLEPTYNNILVSSNGTKKGTAALKLGNDLLSPDYMIKNPNFLFITTTLSTGVAIVKSDGTDTGTSIFTVLPAETKIIEKPIFLNDLLFYVTRNYSNNRFEFWRSDGTSSGTFVLDSGSYYEYVKIISTDNLVYFWVRNQEGNFSLWSTDGSLVNTKLVKDFNVNGQSSGYTNIMGKLGNYLFLFLDSSTGVKLWRTDGTELGTVKIDSNLIRYGNFIEFNNELFFYGESFSKVPFDGPMELILERSFSDARVVNGSIFFLNYDFNSGLEPWISDGTVSGTHIIEDIKKGLGSSNPEILGTVGDKTVWIATDNLHGRELFICDKNGENMQLLKDLNANTKDSNPNSFTKQDDKIVFKAFTDSNGYEIHSYDKANESFNYTDLYSGSGSSNPRHLIEVDGYHYFIADDSTHSLEIWNWTNDVNDATLVKDLSPSFEPDNFSDVHVINNRVLFTAYDSFYQQNLYSLSPGPVSTIERLIPPNYLQKYKQFAELDGKYYFIDYGNGLYSTDGITIELVYNFSNSDSKFQEIIKFKNKLFLSMLDQQSGNQLWVSDGTHGGTKPYNSATYSTLIEPPRLFTIVDDYLYFAAVSISYTSFIYRTDGISGKIEQIRSFEDQSRYLYFSDFVACNGALLYFVDSYSYSGSVLFRTDGTKEGTYFIKSFEDEIDISNKAILGNRLYFNGNSEKHGRELWVTDGTKEGTNRIADICPNACSSNPQNIKIIDSVLYFSAYHPKYGIELWTMPVLKNIGDPLVLDEIEFKILGNPIINQTLVVQFKSEVNEKVFLTIYSPMGQLILQIERDLIEGDNVFNIPLPSSMDGLYFLNYKRNGTQTNKSIFVSQ
jgi:ELWxxDGT repeat protein